MTTDAFGTNVGIQQGPRIGFLLFLFLSSGCRGCILYSMLKNYHFLTIL